MKKSIYLSLPTELKNKAKSILTDFDSVYINRCDGQFDIGTSVMIKTVYADDERSWEITAEDIKNWEK